MYFVTAELLFNDTWVRYDSHLYKYVVDGSVSARGASDACAQKGALLVSINDEQEMLFLKESVLRRRTLSAFIGGSDELKGK